MGAAATEATAVVVVVVVVVVLAVVVVLTLFLALSPLLIARCVSSPTNTSLSPTVFTVVFFIFSHNPNVDLTFPNLQK